MPVVKPGEVAVSETQPQHAIRPSGQRTRGGNDGVWILFDHPQTVNSNQFMLVTADFGPDVVPRVLCNPDHKPSRSISPALDSVEFAAIVAIQIVVDSTPEFAEAVLENGGNHATRQSVSGPNCVDVAILQQIQAIFVQPHRIVPTSGDPVAGVRS